MRRGLPWLLLAMALLAAGFSALGAWQWQRMGWKQALIARIEARVQAPPAPPPSATEWPALRADPQAWEYRRVRLQGRLLHQHEALVQAVTDLGAGFWVLTPLRLADGGMVLVNRGFVPPSARAPAARPAPDEPVEVIGLLRTSEPHGGFLRENDPAADRWHSRDVDAIAAARGLPAAQVAPYFVDAEAAPRTDGAASAWPAGGLTVLRFSDNHLVYAITWFVLAAMSCGAGVLLLQHARAVRPGPPAAGQ